MTDDKKQSIPDALQRVKIMIFLLRKKSFTARSQISNAKCSRGGFTLVEMIVAIGLFIIVLFIASSAFLAVINADRKSRTARAAMSNLTLALEDLSRRIKTGTTYYCGAGGESSGTQDCPAGASQFSFTEQDGVTRTTYRLLGGAIMRKVGSGTELAATASDITISNLKFFVSGSTKWAPGGGGDINQPMVIISISGTTTIGQVASGFTIQTTVTQRAYDI